ncbi:hypothetical protein ED733_002247 [Metarhizium rileyi]|uniref:Uncharacterized protein n=1 Tax=Metarhizium rileyi (strain RCEF 4871) TaxID=1649241 RepID=A0A5C6FYP9_METRR|nr:hypothetical protein ED733_002247 [Metarhizium rileyi]
MSVHDGYDGSRFIHGRVYLERQQAGQQEKKHSSRGKLIKDSAGLLLGIGVAVIVAHRLWPKEVPYGDKENWDTKTAARVRRHDQGDCCRRERPPRRRERGRSRNRPCYESGRPPPPEPVPEPPRWRSRSSRRDPRGRSLEPDPRRVYEDVVDTTRWATHAPDRQQVRTRDAREPSYVSQRCYYQRGGDAGHHLHRNDDIFVVERAVPRYGDRGYR